MPMHMRSFFSEEELKGSKLCSEFKFTKGMPVLKVPYTKKKKNQNIMSNINNASVLFEISNDPVQLNPIEDQKLTKKMKNQIIKKIIELEAPKEILDRFKI